MLSIPLNAVSQSIPELSVNAHNYHPTDTAFFIPFLVRLGCKNFNYQTFSYLIPEHQDFVLKTDSRQKSNFLTVRGSIYYDFIYRSKTDTPYLQGNLQQHTERVNLEITVKNNYPIRVSFNTRQTNSVYYKNFWDIGFHFDKDTYLRKIKNDLFEKYSNLLENSIYKKYLDSTLKANENILLNFKEFKSKEYGPQLEIERKEKSINADIGLKQIPEKFPKLSDIIRAEKSKENISNTFLLQERKVDSLRRKIDSLKNNTYSRLIKIKSIINSNNNLKGIQKLLIEEGEPVLNQKENNLQKFLGNVRNINIGRSNINYTELTTQNVLITGVNLELSGKYYAAIVAGKVDYRFRDFLNNRSLTNNQYLVVGRFGIGNIDKKALIFTLYQGKKSNSTYSTSDSIGSEINIMGYSIEGIWNKDAFTGISAELAKSTKPYPQLGAINEGKEVLWNFREPSNMGISIKAKTRLKSLTRLSGFLRKTGSSFQSFSMFNYNTDQLAWNLRADHLFWKKRIAITAMVRRNDFVNPFADKTYKSSTIFTSLNAVIRVPRWPIMTFGFFPGTQLYMEEGTILRENAYYILNGSLLYQYSLKKRKAITTLNFNHYSNMASDSGFIFYKGKNYFFNQQIDFESFQLQAGYSYNRQPKLQYSTIELGSLIRVGKIGNIGGGLKCSYSNNMATYWGESLTAQLKLGTLGTVQLQYEKSYLPMFTQKLFEVESGRISYYKSF